MLSSSGSRSEAAPQFPILQRMQEPDHELCAAATCNRTNDHPFRLPLRLKIRLIDPTAAEGPDGGGAGFRGLGQ